jgi:ribonuclease HIII
MWKYRIQRSFTKGKIKQTNCPGLDNISSELFKNLRNLIILSHNIWKATQICINTLGRRTGNQYTKNGDRYNAKTIKASLHNQAIQTIQSFHENLTHIEP